MTIEQSKPGNAEPCGYGVFWLEHNNHPCSVLYATENEALAFAARLGIVGSVEPVYRHPAQQGQEGRALAIVRVLACTPPDEWLSKKEIHEELAEFRGQS